MLANLDFVISLPSQESSIYVLVGVNDSRQVNLARSNLRLEFRRDPTTPQNQLSSCNTFNPIYTCNSLRRIGGINNNRLLGRFICHEVGIVVALPRPFRIDLE
jgi:hypothetical protein